MNLTTFWNEVLNDIKPKLKPYIFNGYLQNTELVKKIDEEKTLVVVAQSFAITKIKGDLLDELEECIKEHLNEYYKLKLIEEKEKKKYVQVEQFSLFEVPVEEKVEYKHQSNLNKQYTFDRFVVGTSNRMVHSYALDVAENLGDTNPFFIFGNSGLGKTHLIQAIGNYAEDKYNKKVLYVHGHDIYDDYVTMTNAKNNIDAKQYFYNKYSNIDVLIVDDIQQLAKKTKTQDEFFTVFENLKASKKQIVLASDRKPSEIEDLADRLVTRFTWGYMEEIHATDYELKKEILRRKMKAENSQFTITDEALEYIVNGLPNDVRSIEGAINQLTVAMTMNPSNDKEVTLDLAKEVLQSRMKHETSDNVNIMKIQQVVADEFKITVDDLKSTKKTSNITFPRQIAMYLCRTLLNEPFENIGQEFGGRNHTTPMHAVHKVEKEMKKNQVTFNTVENLKGKFRK